jgi:hypothetical protein
MNRAQVAAIVCVGIILALCAIAPTIAIFSAFPLSMVAQYIHGGEQK